MRPRDYLPSGPLALRVCHDGGAGLRILIPPSHAYLVDFLAKAFEELPDVEVLVDRRRGDRRVERRAVAVERRRSERRRSAMDIGEIVITRTATSVTSG